MRSIRRELETQRDALTNAISSSTRSSKDSDHRRELFKDPFGMASITHDDEVVAAVVDTRARQVEAIRFVVPARILPIAPVPMSPNRIPSLT